MVQRVIIDCGAGHLDSGAKAGFQSKVMKQQELLKRIADRKTVVAIVGMGYVGLPLALWFADEGFTVHVLSQDPHSAELSH